LEEVHIASLSCATGVLAHEVLRNLRTKPVFIEERR